MISRQVASLLTLVIFNFSWICMEMQDFPVVRIKNGLVKGSVFRSGSGRIFYGFRGIPYAKPPTGYLRFRAPVPANDWEEIFDGTKDANQCPQFSKGEYIGVEDCLTIDVYTTQLPSIVGRNNLPVLIEIIGGEFVNAAHNLKKNYPHRWMEKNMIIVSMGFRLGALGFLSTGDAAASGNYCLLDQVLGMKWVKENVDAFGGDPNKITLYGGSTGAMEVGLHLLSPMSKGLFRAAILSSGNALSPTVQQKPWEVAASLAMELGCPTHNTSELVECLRKQTALDISVKAKKIGANQEAFLVFRPTIEDPAYGLFLTRHPKSFLEEGTFNRVPLLTGIARDEGTWLYLTIKHYFQSMDYTFFQFILPQILRARNDFKGNLVKISHAIKADYFSSIDLSNATQVCQMCIDLLSDLRFVSPLDAFIKFMTAYQIPVYNFVFEYVGSATHNNVCSKLQVNHADNVYYIFRNYPMTKADEAVANRLIDAFYSFIAYLNPTPVDNSWKPNTKNRFRYLRVGSERNFSMVNQRYRMEKVRFWNEIVPTIQY